MNVIETKELTKKFGELTAVDSVTLEVKDGEIFGLLGPNGAGKTTLISMLVTMKKPTSGFAKVNGFDVNKQSAEVRKSIGIVFQDPSLDEELTAYENLELHAAMYGVEKKEREKRITEVIKMVELSDRLNDVVKTFSGGMRRRLEIARALLHYPKMLFLDEPTLGLDPQTRQHVWDYIQKLKKEQGITVLLTTHYMDEADSLCDRIAIIDHGKIIALNSSEALKSSLGGDKIVVETKGAEKLAKEIGKPAWLKSAKIVEGNLELHVELGEQRIPGIIKSAEKAGVSVTAITMHKPTLGDVFLEYTGRSIREESGSQLEANRLRRRAWGGRK